MKKILSCLLAVVVIGLAQGNAWAGSRVIANYYGYSNVTQTTTAILAGQTVIVNNRGSLIYNITANATGASGECDIYDTNAGPTTTETPTYEVKVATSGDSRSVDMSGAPLEMFNGIVVTSSNATCYINAQY